MARRFCFFCVTAAKIPAKLGFSVLLSVASGMLPGWKRLKNFYLTPLAFFFAGFIWLLPLPLSIFSHNPPTSQLQLLYSLEKGIFDSYLLYEVSFFHIS